MEILFVFILLYAGKHAWDQAWGAWRKSRSAYLDRADKRHPDMPKSRRAGHALRHDLGYGLSQAAHGFPQVRHGFASGWHQGRQAHAQVRAERERAKAEHLETRARLIPDLIEYRRRQKKALEQIRAGGAPGNACPQCGWRTPYPPGELCDGCDRGLREAGEGGEGRQDSTPEPKPADGRTYSYGNAAQPLAWPTDDPEVAHGYARAMSAGGDTWLVHEYPPGDPQPGRLLATYVKGKPVADCDLCGKPLPPGYAGIPHPDCIDAHEDDATPTEGDTVPTGTASGDTTYTQQMNELTAIRQDAEEEVNSVRRKRMLNRLDVLSGLGLDSASLSEAAAIDDALRDQQKAAQQTLDAADTAIGGLKQRHGGIKEAVDSAPIAQPAQPEFYAD